MAKKKGQIHGLHLSSSPSANRRLESKADEKTQTIYANNANIEFTNFDVKIKLGVIESATPELLTVREVTHVYMSHDHVRAFSLALATTIQQFDDFKKRADAEAAKTH
jgi:hypothetical protein